MADRCLPTCCCNFCDPCALYEQLEKKQKLDKSNSFVPSLPTQPTSTDRAVPPPFQPHTPNQQPIKPPNQQPIKPPKQQPIKPQQPKQNPPELILPPVQEQDGTAVSRGTPTFRRGGNSGIGAATSISEASLFATSFPINTGHDPDSIGWITPETWENAEWDGVPIDVTGKTIQEICALLFPTANTMRGLREYFYEIKPFADNKNPTVAEIENWNIHTIKHLRKLIGSSIPIEIDHCLMLRAQWGLERKWSTVWDVDYPGAMGSSSGPCQLNGQASSNSHCGASFLPSAEDQVAYGRSLLDPCRMGAGTEGIATVPTNLPWAIKLSRVISQFVCTEGMVGHAGPFFTRTKVGMSWHHFGKDGTAGAATEFRGKWSG